MTRGKNALSDIPKNHRIVINPPKFITAVTSTVKQPNENIMAGSTRLGPNFLPKIPRNGAVKT